MVEYLDKNGNEISKDSSNSLWYGIHKREKGEFNIQDEFISYYELVDVIFDNYEIKPKQKNIAYILVRMIYEDIDWQLYEKRVNKIFEKIWKNTGFDKDKRFPNFDLRFHLYIQLSNYLKRRIFNDIYLELAKLVATNLYRKRNPLKLDERIKIFKKFVEDFNTNSKNKIKTYSNEFTSQSVIIKLMLGKSQSTIAESGNKIKKYDNIKYKRLDDETREIYLKTLKKNDEDKKSKRKDNYMGSMRKVLKYNDRRLKKHYRKFMSFIERNNIKTYKDMKKMY